MKNKKWISLAGAAILVVTALPRTAFAEKKAETEETLGPMSKSVRRIFLTLTRRLSPCMPKECLHAKSRKR